MAEFFTHAFFWWPVFILAALGLAAARPSRGIGIIAVGILLIFFSSLSAASGGTKGLLWTLYGILVLVLWLPFLRHAFISRPLLKFYRASMPELSATERD